MWCFTYRKRWLRYCTCVLQFSGILIWQVILWIWPEFQWWLERDGRLSSPQEHPGDRLWRKPNVDRGPLEWYLVLLGNFLTNLPSPLPYSAEIPNFRFFLIDLSIINIFAWILSDGRPTNCKPLDLSCTQGTHPLPERCISLNVAEEFCTKNQPWCVQTYTAQYRDPGNPAVFLKPSCCP